MINIAELLVSAACLVALALAPERGPDFAEDIPLSGGHVPIITLPPNGYTPGQQVQIQVTMQYSSTYLYAVNMIKLETSNAPFPPGTANPTTHTIPGINPADTLKTYLVNPTGGNQYFTHTFSTTTATSGSLYVRVVSYVNNGVVASTSGAAILETPAVPPPPPPTGQGPPSGGAARIGSAMSDRVNGLHENVVLFVDLSGRRKGQSEFFIEAFNKPYPGAPGFKVVNVKDSRSSLERVVIRIDSTWTIEPVYFRLCWRDDGRVVRGAEYYKVLVGPWFK